jgi:hypothetical protein
MAVCAAPLGAQRWQMQYLYDQMKSTLSIDDFQCPSASHGVAVGVIEEGTSRKPVAVVTSDGGAHWQLRPLKEEPFSLFFLNDNLGWMVTEKGLWRTGDAGKSWTKLPKVSSQAQALRVYFADESRGWAACTNRTVLETHDGAQHWTPVAAAASQPGNPLYSAYSWIAFANPQAGLITGANEPIRRERLPDWLEPATAVGARETPHLSLTLQTFDGGKTWKADSTSMFGEITRSRFSPPHFGLGLIEHDQSFQYPSEVFRIEWPSGKNQIVYHDEHFFISDVWVTPGGAYYLAGIEIASKLRNVVPQKAKVLMSRDLTTWTPTGMDYRATANRVFLGGAGEDALWLATNNGMILKLAP